MGRSITVHCIGYGKKNFYTAMNRVEIAQQIEKAKRDGDEIEYWIAQTKTGKRILDIKPEDLGVKLTKDLKLPKLVTCPVCNGDGVLNMKHNGKYRVVHRCPVCNGSGICKRGNERKWDEWQIEKMRKEHKEYKQAISY